MHGKRRLPEMVVEVKEGQKQFVGLMQSQLPIVAAPGHLQNDYWHA